MSKIKQPNQINLGGTLNALSLSPSRDHVVVAGREVLKIVSFSEETFSEVLNLRTGGRTNLNSSSVDVKWNQRQNSKYVATAATNGAVVIWNMGFEGQKLERVLTDHKRTVYRLSWHPDHEFTLLSGSQDGTMRIWDVREPKNHSRLFESRLQPVRDVQFSPKTGDYFVAAFEDGSIQVWDIRKTSCYERKITAHQGPVLCIRWHLEDKTIFASGGRDRFIQMWDLNEPSKPIASIETVLSVAHIEWRPGHPHHIASSALMDSKIHVWNIKRPSIPYASFSGHHDVVTDIQWQSPNSIFSCGKDKILMEQTMEDAYRPYEHINTVGISWAPKGSMAVLNDKINRADQEDGSFSTNYTIGSPSNSDFFATSPKMLSHRRKKEKGIVYVFKTDGSPQFDGSNNYLVVMFLAEHYKFRNGTFSQLCEQNASTARFMKQYQIMQTWKLLKLFYENESVLNASKKFSSTSSLFQTDFLSPKSSSKKVGSVNISKTNKSEQENATKQVRQSDILSSIMEDSSQRDENEEKHQSFNSLDDFLPSDIVAPLSALPSNSTLPPPVPPPPPATDEEKVFVAPNERDGLTNYLNRFKQELRWDPTPHVIKMLDFYADIGDVQSCVIMSLVLGDRVPIKKEKLQTWIIAYIELLHQLQLWVPANELIKYCKLEEVKMKNKKATTLHTNCPSCNKPLLNTGYYCERCEKLTNTCSIW